MKSYLKPGQRAIPLTPYHPIWEGAAIAERDWHFHRRLYERYSIILHPGEFSEILRATKKRKKAYYSQGDAYVFAVFIPSAQETIYVLTKNGVLISAVDRKHAERERRKLKEARARDE